MDELLDLKVDSKTKRTSNRESEHREFKLGFENNSLWKYAKTMAAFANRDGGVIFFGVRNRPRELVGIGENAPDELVFAHFLKEYFEPAVSFELGTKTYAGVTLLYVVVAPAISKPVLCKKVKVLRAGEKGKPDTVLLREGAIYYRYSSSSEEIKFPELRGIWTKA